MSSKKMKCFVIMPFGSNDEYARGNIESDYIYKYIICPGINKFEKEMNTEVCIVREVDRGIPGSITKSIINNIAESDICITDITGKNANVFLELGIRYSLRHKTTILLRQENTNIPFDIAGFRCITYDCFDPERAIDAIADFLLSSINDISVIDSLVFETFPNMEVHIPGVVTSTRESFGLLPLTWDEWWFKVLDLARLLKDPYDNGRFVPSVILGISNGGLMIADLLGREVFKGVPIVSLWANRWLTDKNEVDQSCYYFDNEFNKCIIQTVKNYATKLNGVITVLLVDDLVFTSSTISQATFFLKKELKCNFDVLFAPLYCRDTDYLQTIEDILPFSYKNGSIFSISREQYYERLRTQHASFPYRKSLGMA